MTYTMLNYRLAECIYTNPLATPDDIRQFRMEGDGAVSFPMRRMRLESTRSPEEAQAANIVFWCDKEFPDNIEISWDFYPIREPGLVIMFFSARGQNGQDIFDPDLAPRRGPYNQYHHGDINALHVSYFRRNIECERAFTTCNLRKSYGFHLVKQGADPIPSVPDARPPYRIKLVKAGAHVVFYIGQSDNDHIEVFHWIDDERHGPVLSSGKIGFRQMAPMIGEYCNLKVHSIKVENA